MIKLEEVMDSPVCYGCGACVSMCPSDAVYMRTDKKGFRRPGILKSKCTGCNLCYRTCPAVKANRDALFSASPGSAKAVLSVRNRDNDIRKLIAKAVSFVQKPKGTVLPGGCSPRCRIMFLHRAVLSAGPYGWTVFQWGIYVRSMQKTGTG